MLGRRCLHSSSHPRPSHDPTPHVDTTIDSSAEMALSAYRPRAASQNVRRRLWRKCPSANETCDRRHTGGVDGARDTGRGACAPRERSDSRVGSRGGWRGTRCGHSASQHSCSGIPGIGIRCAKAYSESGSGSKNLPGSNLRRVHVCRADSSVRGCLLPPWDSSVRGSLLPPRGCRTWNHRGEGSGEELEG